MAKRDFASLVRIYSVAAFFILILAVALFNVFRDTLIFWPLNDLALKVTDLSVLIFLLGGLVISIFVLIRYHKGWLRLEHARMKPDLLPLYNLNLPELQNISMPVGFKKKLAHSDAIKITQVFSVLWLLIGVILVIFVFIGLTNTKTALMFILFVVVPIFIGAGIYLLLIAGFIMLSAYECLEANEDGFMRRKGLLCRSLSWEAACLFAVSGKADNYWIELSSTNVRLRWPFSVKSHGIFGGPSYTYLVRASPEMPYQSVSREEYQRQLLCLYKHVQLKTSLPLFDLR